MSDSASFSESARRGLLEGDLAEIFLLLDFLASGASGFDRLADAGATFALRQPKSSGETSPTLQIDADLENPTTLIRRVCAIKRELDLGGGDRDWVSDTAFLFRAKDALNELASPARSLTIAFTSMVFNALADSTSMGRPSQSIKTRSRNFSENAAEMAFPGLSGEARRLARSIKYVIPAAIVFATIIVAMTAAVANLPAASEYHWLAQVALSIGVLPALLGLLGALAAILRRFQQLAAAHLLTPRQRSRHTVEAWLGLIAGSGVWLLSGGPVNHPTIALPVFPLSFLAGYSTELVFSLLDALIDRIFRSNMLRLEPPRMNTLLKNQSAIANAVTQIHDQIEQFQGTVKLDAFEGAVIVNVRRSNGDSVPIRELILPTDLGELQETLKATGVLLCAGQPYELCVTLDRRATTATDAIVEAIATGAGPIPDSVTFEASVNARGIVFLPKVQDINIERRSMSVRCAYRFTAPILPGRYDIFAEISQKNRLLQVALLPVLVENNPA